VLGAGLGVSRQAPVLARPLLDVLALPDLPHVKVCFRRGEVGPVDELLNPLAADAEHTADLSRPD
jgi:hypothetical protein